MKKVNYVIALAVSSVIFFGCGSMQSISHFSSETVWEGMTGDEIIKKFGKPYKEDFERDSNNLLKEKWYYKEILFKNLAAAYELNSILHLHDKKLVKYEMGEEQRLTEVSVVEKKKDEK